MEEQSHQKVYFGDAKVCHIFDVEIFSCQKYRFLGKIEHFWVEIGKNS